jgi:WD40 repeat protein
MSRWSQEGEYLLSGSDDHRLFIWSAYDKFAVRKVLDTGISIRKLESYVRTYGKYLLGKVLASYK